MFIGGKTEMVVAEDNGYTYKFFVSVDKELEKEIESKIAT